MLNHNWGMTQMLVGTLLAWYWITHNMQIDEISPVFAGLRFSWSALKTLISLRTEKLSAINKSMTQIRAMLNPCEHQQTKLSHNYTLQSHLGKLFLFLDPDNNYRYNRLVQWFWNSEGCVSCFRRNGYLYDNIFSKIKWNH